MELKNGLADLTASIARAGVAPGAITGRSTYLHPGHLVVSAEPRLLTTILGSCVAVCLWDAAARIGGMVHFLLPESSGGAQESTARYGDIAVPQLLRELKARGANQRFITAKLYGGACVLQALRKDNGDHLGTRNVGVAKRALQTANIRVVEEDTLGTGSRKVIFDTGTGNTTIHVVNDVHGN
jgi:chemotaxis protein CheD